MCFRGNLWGSVGFHKLPHFLEVEMKFDGEFVQEVLTRFPGTVMWLSNKFQEANIDVIEGYHCYFPNGFVMSVQFGFGTYSSNHDWGMGSGGTSLVDVFQGKASFPDWRETAETAEIAGWWYDNEDIEHWITWEDGDQVLGYQTPEQVFTWMAKYGGQSK